MKTNLTREEAVDLLRKYNQDRFHLLHALTVEGVMRWYARSLGYEADEEFWGIVGLLHDIDFEQYPEQHCIKAPDLLRSRGASEEVIHAVDTVTAKVELAVRAHALGIPIISAMGAGNKLDPTKLKVADIYETNMCPLARTMRRELRRRGIPRLKVVFSTEAPVKTSDDPSISCCYHCVCPPGTVRKCTVRRDIPGSTAFVPPVMGLIIAGEIVRALALEKA